jgi:drug/metabolite transporter (DMT)-like permease
MKREDATHRIDLIGTSAILAAMLCWTCGPLFIRYLTEYLDAWSQNFWRYLIAMFFWLPYLAWSVRKGRVTRTLIKRALWPSLANIIMQSLWAWSFYYLKPGFATLLAKSSVIWTALICLIYFPDERGLVRSKSFWLAIGFSLAGVAIIIIAKPGFDLGLDLIGIVIMLSAALAWSFYTFFTRIAFRDSDPRLGFSVVSIYTVIGLGILAIFFGNPQQIVQLPASPLAGVIVSSILSISLAHTLYYTSILRIGATIPSLLMQLSPFATLLLSLMIFGERLSLWQWFGGGIIVFASVLSIQAQQHLRNTTKRT